MEEKLNNFWLTDSKGLEPARMEDFAIEISAPDVNTTLSLQPVRTGVPANLTASGLISLPAADLEDLPAPSQRLSLATVQRMQELCETNRRLAELCTQWELLATERLAEVNALRESMNDLCHALTNDVRGPLRWIAGFSQLLSEPTTPANAAGDYPERIQKAALQLEQLTQDLLKYGRINLETAPCVPVSTETCVCKVLSDFSEVIGNRLAEVQVEGPLPLVQGNAALLHLVFTQLIDNALKFVAPKTAPRLRIWGQTGPSGARIHIDDNGVGIPASQSKRIFGLFQRLDTDLPGTGAGLALVQKAMEKMDGQVGLKSLPGQGTRFWIELPNAS